MLLSPPLPTPLSSGEGNSSLYLFKSLMYSSEQLEGKRRSTSLESLPQKSCCRLGLSDLEEGSNLTVIDEDSAETLSSCKIKSGWEI